jgi:hypothetical protein
MQRSVAGLAVEYATFAAAAVAVVIGMRAPMAQYLSPQTGLGYLLGIIGGSMMLVLLIYPLRKRFRAFRFLGGVPEWFQVHMILGVVGPVLVLYHSNFSLGATNSNVALFCMLVVSGSGFIGRYLYAKIHHGLYGRKTTLQELQARGQSLKVDQSRLPMLPHLLGRIEGEEQRLMSWGASPLAVVLTPVGLRLLATGARWRLRRYIARAVAAAAVASPVVASQRVRMLRVARDYTERRLRASCDVANLLIYERLFSLWHVLHLPLFFMLLAAGIVHVVAVHLY